MAARQALQLGEILQLIFDYFSPEQHPSSHANRVNYQHTLATCARVNKSFNDVAVDVLWKHMHGITPLLRVLPAFQWAEITDSDDDAPQLGLFGRLHPKDLRRFREYAQRITDLTISNYALQVDPSALFCLLRALGGQSLLPRLRRLHWTQFKATNCDVLYFASPSLRTLTLYYEGSQDTPEASVSINSVPCEFLFEAVCEQMAAVAPCLETLTITSICTPCYFPPFARCRGLREVSISGELLTSQCANLSTLSSLDNLAKLEVRGVVQLHRDEVLGFQGFHALQELSIEGEPESLGHILMCLASSDATIRKLDIELNPTPTPQETFQLMNILKTHSSAALEDVTVMPLPMWSNGDATQLFEPIRPLLDIRNLRTVRCMFARWPCDLSDDDLCMMADAWPNLVSLTVRWLHAEDMARPRVLPSLDCLPRIARSCSRLQSLTMTCAAMTFTAGVEVMSHCLSHLRIEKTSWAPEKILAMDVALFFDRLFPYLDLKTLRESRTGRDSAQLCRAWAQVCDHLQSFRTVRAQERKRLEGSSL
ncbi:uncharacterized protein B0H18DRAFT_1119968 [Fomitopsis serialis]|uniref:uncharacterized protein n=1 Tax=Fomitopsis serialis TaxID=139415 RepID=UPI002008492A|nr:uncharacterized protein B0H18DRAFT_1119968 [Neoantrodia serialis]KAH9924437.1 hypothetical protein B0H18DRAFT_1119968 [Neoantrodia serialis]